MTTSHVVSVQRYPYREASCICGQSYADPDPTVLTVWILEHLGIPVRNPLRLRSPGCHSTCIGEDHCLIDGDGGGD